MDRQKKLLGQLFDAAEVDATNESLLTHLKKVNLRYLRLNKVGSGAMKNVFRTEDRKTGRLVAMAVLKNYDDSKAVESFIREAKISAKLQHPHIVPVYDIDVDENQRPYFTMKLLPGTNLKEILKGLSSEDSETLKKYPLPVLIDIFLKVCEAVAYAHSQGVCHLDLKPDNIRVSTYGEVMLCDWGLANFLDEDSEPDIDTLTGRDSFRHYNSFYKTLHGQIKGTPGYMAPEQATGKREVKDQRTDVFSLGCILYELLTHCAAIEGNKLEEILKNTCSKPPVAPSKRSPTLHIPQSLEAICLKALKIQASERYEQVEAIIVEIEAYRNGYATIAEEASIFKQLSLLFSRNKSFCYSVLIFLCIVVSMTYDFINNIKVKERIAVNALGNEKQMRIIVFNSYEELRGLEEIKLRVGQKSAFFFSDLAIVQFKKGNYDQASDFAQFALFLDSKNLIANSIAARMKMAKKQYESAMQMMESHYYKDDQSLINICKAAINLSNHKRISYQSIYQILQKNINPERTLLINLILKPYLNLNNSRYLKLQLNWLLKARNDLDELKFSLKYEDTLYSADLSNNPGLKEIFFLRMLPLFELDISSSSFDNANLLTNMKLTILHINSTPIKSLDFVNNMPDLKELHISKGAFPKSTLTQLRKTLKIIEK